MRLHKYILIITLAVFLFSPFLGKAQKYNRNSLTVCVLNTGGKYSSDIVNASHNIKVPDKFDSNLLNKRVLTTTPNKTLILNEINKNGIPQMIIAKWFMRDSVTGKFNMELIHQRGMYNATSSEVSQSETKKIGLATLKDAGESLINKSYIFVLAFDNILTMQQIYNRRDIAKKALAESMDKNYTPVRRVKTGWMGDAYGYLYKLNFNDSLLDIFYNDLWIYEDDPDSVKQIKKDRFEKMAFPVEFVTVVKTEADGSQYKQGHPLATPRPLTRNELFQKMINTGLAGCVERTERFIESFKVKAPVYKTKPISAKIGKKEGLKTDARFFVMESNQNKQGEVENKRKGVVRVKKAIDNRKIATSHDNNFSVFYQTAGKVIEPGMVLYQKNDIGIGLSGGYSIGEIAGGWGKIEFNMARMASAIGDLGITQLKLFGSFGFENKTYNFMNEGKNYNFLFSRWQIGLSKGFYVARIFSFAPFVAFGAESGSNSDMNYDYSLRSDDFIGTDYFNCGVNATFNITYFFQFYSSVNYIMPFPYTYTKQRNIFDLSKFQDKKYTDFFDDRNGLSIDLGFRIEF
jgi:hypothetical protein